MTDIKNLILEGTIEVFREKGLKFTMDDLARRLGMSKKTIYTVYKEKEELFLAMVDYVFDSIKQSEQEILEDDSLSTVEKLKNVLGVLPKGYREIEFGQLYSLKDKYPTIYCQVEKRLETGWEKTIALIEQGMQEGAIRPVSIPIVKIMLEASIERFFQRDVLAQNQIAYADALDGVVGIIMKGIEMREPGNR
ncbi:MAG: TetR/AcrR family transcriptional regulator [Acetatifactor sp.]|jgi:AcrR family transcriptional regulator|nr:TetR/AcrR family transcriptional regulator [Acetatifactor sp.]